MARFLVRRVAQSLVTLFAVSVFAFGMIHLVPGDPVSIALGTNATPQAVKNLRHAWGLDRPLAVQYGDFVGHALHGDFGTSIRSEQPVMSEIGQRLGSTVALAFAATVVSVPLGLVLGVLAGVARRRIVDVGVMGVALLGLSMPTFWSGTLLILLFGLTLGLLPVAGDNGFAALVLPAITLALPAAAVLARLTRGSMLEVVRQDYVRTAWAKGLGRFSVVFRHALPNAVVPVITIMGLQIGTLLSGTVIVESVFARPGIGRLAVQAIEERDFPLVQGVVLLAGVVFVLVNLVTDLVYPLVDPRIRL
ncbi:MAG TPA: ABC transporter permease [Streptosporangiales bacterium]